MQIIDVQDYQIFVGTFWTAFAELLANRNYSKIAVLVDQNTKEHCLPLLQKNIDTSDFVIIEIPAGELNKNIDTCQLIWRQMMEKGIDRKSLTVNLGGGVIGDMGGFCAATFKRGMHFVQMPTTLLSQVDASIGGKLGIDFQHIKNSVGVFANPQAVFIDPNFYHTLPPQEVRSGFAEIIKHALIYDAAQWESLRKITDLTTVDWSAILVPSLNIKKEVVQIDPFEYGLRKALNFGHTIGHAVESLALESDTPLLHGEAIAIGMICEAWLSYKMVGLTKKELDQITDFILKIYGHVPQAETQFDDLVQLMTKDKKNEGATINFSLIAPPGTVHINQTAEADLIKESLAYYNGVIK